ncbi:YdcF family protein [uncultured Tateyamaria sp.]|uniref:YdcF family protein n=1 Tax=uncultured Tateyamaria sp. TaxID=455651 RepID=UPI002618C0BF|nr:YdcF family protein [uncultured Tateyamaria sp.]
MTANDVPEAARTLWHFHHVNSTPSAADVIIGLGSYDIRVAARCAELFKDGFAPRIIFTGASGNWTSDLFPASEADAFRDHAHQLGVPTEAITLEPRATNIGENVRFCADLVPDAKQVIFVTKPQTQLRCLATAEHQWPGVKSLVTAPDTAFEDQPLPHHDQRALICEMVGDLDRMRTYVTLGFQRHVDVPEPVTQAFDALVAAGYVDHLPQPRP